MPIPHLPHWEFYVLLVSTWVIIMGGLEVSVLVSSKVVPECKVSAVFPASCVGFLLGGPVRCSQLCMFRLQSAQCVNDM